MAIVVLGTFEPWVAADVVVHMPNTIALVPTSINEPSPTHFHVYAVNVTCSYERVIVDRHFFQYYVFGTWL